MTRTLVIGGGLGGSLLALYLSRRGYQVEVYERHADERARKSGRRPSLNLTLCERGLHALEAVGARGKVLDHSAPARGRIVHVNASTVYQPYGSQGEAIHSISRSDLNDVLLELAEAAPGVRCHFGKRCVGVDLDTGTVEFEDVGSGQRTRATADLIFGADGAFSAVRREFQRVEGFNYSQAYWRHGGYKSLVIPARPDGSPALEPGALHIWPRGERMLIGFPNRSGHVTLSLLLPLSGPDSYASLRNESELQHFFRQNFDDVADLIPNLAQQFFEKAANSLLTIRCDPWTLGPHTLLIGDAAHAVLPSYGQGANAAFEDCAVLDRCLAEHAPDFPAAFRAFEAARRPSLDVMAALAVEHFSELCDLIADPKFLKRKAIEQRLHDLYPSLYRSLYSMVTFSTMPYAEALEIEFRQRALLDGLLLRHDLENELDSAEIREALVRSAAETVTTP
jgi:kynurenine 3-monooxygenase